ncbi:MAG TPA: serine/threonine-protein kinase, partial [Polyangiales bacterium]|nr:serine/threonine-protein kinase [Polyangiales bacterium]
MRLLGEGGMSSVYEAEHALIRRKVAVKVLRSELSVDGVQVQRFFNEARATSAIRHPNIVEVIDVGRLPDGVPYLVMELLEGESLGDRLERIGPLDIPLAIDYARQAASALEAAHALKVVHRDLKPDNLFLVPDQRLADRELVKVLDFGIAKLRGELAAPPFDTLVGAVLGTPPYMSPEQCRGLPEEIDERTDVYALGIILYEMVCGQPPFMADGAGELMMLHMTADPEPPSHARPELPPALEDVILRALEKRREDRFPSMAEFGAALAEIATSHGLPEPSGVRRSNPAPVNSGRAAFESTEPALMFNGDLERERAVTRALARRASMPTDTASGVVRLSPEDHAAAAAFGQAELVPSQPPIQDRPDQSTLRPSRAAPPVAAEPPRSAGDRWSAEASRPSGARLPEPPRSAGDRWSAEASRP